VRQKERKRNFIFRQVANLGLHWISQKNRWCRWGFFGGFFSCLFFFEGETGREWNRWTFGKDCKNYL